MSYEQGSVVTIDVAWESAVTDLRLTIRPPDDQPVVKTFSEVEQDEPNSFHYDVVGDQAGDWFYLWEALTPGLGPKEGTFQIDANQTTIEGVTDPRDVRVLIPRVRRAIDGPTAMSPLSPATTLNDDEVMAMIADAIADLILYTGSAFGHTLEASARDPFYYAPVAWIVDPEFNVAEGSVVVAQSALNFFFHKLQDLKTSEEISDEGQTWSWQMSANLIRDQMKMLQDARDKALEIVMRESTLALDTYVSFLAVRDRLTATYIEPYGTDVGGIGGQQDLSFLSYDPRFETG